MSKYALHTSCRAYAHIVRSLCAHRTEPMRTSCGVARSGVGIRSERNGSSLGAKHHFYSDALQCQPSSVVKLTKRVQAQLSLRLHIHLNYRTGGLCPRVSHLIVSMSHKEYNKYSIYHNSIILPIRMKMDSPYETMRR